MEDNNKPKLPKVIIMKNFSANFIGDIILPELTEEQIDKLKKKEVIKNTRIIISAKDFRIESHEKQGVES